MTETELRENIRDAASKLGWEFYFCWSSLHSPRGFPDLVLVRPPRLIFAELKTQKGQLSPEQQVWRQLLEACPGVDYFLWRPAGWDSGEIGRILVAG